MQTYFFKRCLDFVVKNVWQAISCPKYNCQNTPSCYNHMHTHARKTAWMYIYMVYIMIMSTKKISITHNNIMFLSLKYN